MGGRWGSEEVSIGSNVEWNLWGRGGIEQEKSRVSKNGGYGLEKEGGKKFSLDGVEAKRKKKIETAKKSIRS